MPAPGKNTPCFIAGAGPAGLAAAITLAHNGGSAVVHERAAEIGHRFHGDFQGLENWTTERDVLEELSDLGIKPDFDAVPYREVVCFEPDGRESRCRSTQPLFYLVHRGGLAGTLDTALKRQALDAGVEIRFNSPCSRLVEGGIVAQGPHRADVIAVGYTFETDRADNAFVVLSDRLAPRGYAYLLINGGRGTLASCMFTDFHNENFYLERTVDFFRRNAGLAMRNGRRFGGSGNFFIPRTARKGAILHVGETAGFQDAFAGFGMRYALWSGHLAAHAVFTGRTHYYDRMWKGRFGALLRTSAVNRYIYGTIGEPLYRGIIRSVVRSGDARVPLRKQYNPALWKSILYPLAKNYFGRRLKGMCVDEACRCTWCRCQHAS